MPVVLGTAGHIDHGKTSLVRALTGTDCDRLGEEKRRGITIELGFAHVPLPNGERLGIVDVPGHERFVKNMVAGAAGIDFVMLVIAADEGVMPQTREHLEICSLLGIRHGLVVLTKVDMVDADWLNLAQEDVTAFLAGTFLEHAPIFPVSSVTGQGMEALREHLYAQAAQLAPVRHSDIFRLPVDRVFTMKGHGTVITGTVVSGTVQVGQEAVFMPADCPTRVRNVQSHGYSAQSAQAGQRCAVNVQGLDVEDIERGQVLAHPQTLFPAQRWMVRLRCLRSAPRALRHRTEIHFHHEAREVAARLYFFDRDRLNPGESALTEVRFAEPMVGILGDRCVVRAYSPLRTVAGGELVHPLGCMLRKSQPDFAARFALLSSLPEKTGPELADNVALLLAQVQLAGSAGVRGAELAVLTSLESRRLEKVLQTCNSQGAIFCFDREEKAYVSAEVLQQLMDKCQAHAAAFHTKEKLKSAMARGVLAAGWGKALSPKLVHFVVERCLKAGILVVEGDGLRLASHTVALGGEQSTLKEKILAVHVAAGLTPPNLKDVLESLNVDAKQAAPILKMLSEEKTLVKVKDGLYYGAEALEDIKGRVRQWFVSHDDLDPSALKEILDGLSRKYLIALLEYFDRERMTVRVGDKRQLRGGKQ
ncbi:MAG: selenocysteine-specific translation elongation factor [Desulfovibrionaceae bacterium]